MTDPHSTTDLYRNVGLFFRVLPEGGTYPFTSFVYEEPEGNNPQLKDLYDSFELKSSEPPLMALLKPGEIAQAREKQLDKNISLKLSMFPYDRNSSTMVYNMPTFDGTEGLRYAIHWVRRLEDVFLGLKIHNDVEASRHYVVRQASRGTARRVYDEAIHHALLKAHRLQQEAVVDSMDRLPGEDDGTWMERKQVALSMIEYPTTPSNYSINQAIERVITFVAPLNALKKQKTYMLHAMKKPEDMTVREFWIQLGEMNEELTFLPPFKRDTARLTPAEIISIMERVMPHKWVSKFREFNYHVEVPNCLNACIRFFEECERLETIGVLTA